MSKQVPGSKNQDVKTLTEEEQMEILRQKLMGHEVFGKTRGRLNIGLLDIMQWIIAKKESPASAKKKLEKYFGNAMVMFTLLCQLKRDGHDFAYEQLCRVLEKNLFLQGEDFPLQDKSPLTLMIIDPELIFRIMKIFFCLNYKRQEIWFNYARHCTYVFQEELPKMQELISIFPALKQAIAMYYNDAAKKDWSCDSNKNNLGRFISEKALYENLALCLERHLLNLGFNPAINFSNDLTYSESARLSNINCENYITRGYCAGFEGLDQKEVLAQYSREKQKHIATWQIDLPVLIREHPRFYNDLTLFFGFHPEAKHADIKKKAPAFSSKGISHDYGVVCLYNGMTPDETKKYEDDPNHLKFRLNVKQI